MIASADGTGTGTGTSDDDTRRERGEGACGGATTTMIMGSGRRRHLSTVGIGPVFLGVHTEGRAEGATTTEEVVGDITTEEVVGDIKQTPEDFVVREVSYFRTRPADDDGDENEGDIRDGEAFQVFNQTRISAGGGGDRSSKPPSDAEEEFRGGSLVRLVAAVTDSHALPPGPAAVPASPRRRDGEVETKLEGAEDDDDEAGREEGTTKVRDDAVPGLSPTPTPTPTPPPAPPPSTSPGDVLRDYLDRAALHRRGGDVPSPPSSSSSSSSSAAAITSAPPPCSGKDDDDVGGLDGQEEHGGTLSARLDELHRGAIVELAAIGGRGGTDERRPAVGAVNGEDGPSSAGDGGDDVVWIPTPPPLPPGDEGEGEAAASSGAGDLESSSATTGGEKDDDEVTRLRVKAERGAFHLALRECHPLFSSDVVTTTTAATTIDEESSESRTAASNIPGTAAVVDDGPDRHGGDSRRRAILIGVRVDRTFFGLASFLSDPVADIVGLYRFRNRGPPPPPPPPSSPTTPSPAAVATGNDDREEAMTGPAADHRRDRGRGRGRGGAGGGRRHGRRRGGRTRTARSNEEESSSSSAAATTAVLRLRPNLGRDDRRRIHRIVQDGCRDFETRTVVTATAATASTGGGGGDGDDAGGTSSSSPTGGDVSIVVFWSRRAMSRLARKRRRVGDVVGGDECGGDGAAVRRRRATGGRAHTRATHTLCVVEKRGMEHLDCVNRLARAVRCRPSDIGLAGIKDMRALTSQFVTFRNVRPDRVRSANDRLPSSRRETSTGTEAERSTVRLGNFKRTDRLLNRGDLHGNRFEIVVRKLGAVIVHRDDLSPDPSSRDVVVSGGGDDDPTRQQRPAETVLVRPRITAARMMDAVERVRSAGFVNFFGEQRVGDAGDTSSVGVRPYEIGRAMLRRDFSAAVDLLIRGRLATGGGDGGVSSSGIEREREEISNARRVWIDSGGDPSRTLRALPKRGMDRERAVLVGLKRYGKSDPLSGLRCLPHDVRTFYVNSYQSYVWNSMATKRLIRFGTRTIAGDMHCSDEDCGCVHVVAGDDDPSSIPFDRIVLPLPGRDVVYPKNEVGDMYREILRRDGVEFDKGTNTRDWTARGGYRRIVAKVRDLEWEDVSDSAGMEEPGGGARNIEAVKLRFELDRGCYATMMLRELMLTTAHIDR